MVAAERGTTPRETGEPGTNGDAGARFPMTVDDFCDAYYDRVVGFAVHAYGRNEAEDVAHETLSRALVALPTLDPARDPWPWLATVARNCGRNERRRRWTVDLDDAEALALTTPDAGFEAAAAAEELATLRAALDTMPEAERELLLMRERDGLSFAEIASRVGRSPGALRIQALRARQRLAAIFADLGGTAYGIGVVVSARLVRLRERVAGLAAAMPAAGQLAAVVVVTGGLAGGAASSAGATAPTSPDRATTRSVATTVAAAAPRVASTGDAPVAGRTVSRGVVAPVPATPPPAPAHLEMSGLSHTQSGSRSEGVSVPATGDRQVEVETSGAGRARSLLPCPPAETDC